jgi:SAM-dependent MidA family methyltransferase
VTPLERALRERIQAEGPITVEAFMEACNAYYYATRDPLGARGDFTTAPEIGQMFGEMIGAALADCWNRAGAPTDAIYVELGPGRGTLASDALRVMRAAGFAGELHLVETSPILRDLQKQAVPDAHWHESVGHLPARPLLLVANEFLDALPIRQHVAGWGPRFRPGRRDHRNLSRSRRVRHGDRDLSVRKGWGRIVHRLRP